MKLFWQLLGLDLLTKLLAVTIAPDNAIFALKYNPNMIMGIEAHWVVKYLLPILIMPLPFITYKYFKDSIPQWTLSLIYAGVVGNYLGRFSDKGVVDFIHCQVFICNFADVYLWIGAAVMFKIQMTSNPNSIS